MKSAPFVTLFFLIASTSADVWGQTVSSQANSSAQASAESAGPPQSLTQAESFELVNSLNKAEKLFPESFIVPGGPGGDKRLMGLKVVKREDCFGVRLADGRRIVGESSGGYYGVFGVRIENNKPIPFAMIGLLYAEFPFSIDNRQFPSGPYIVLAFKDALQLQADDEKQSRYDSNLRKHVPLERHETLALNTPLPDLAPAKNRRFSVAVENGSIVLSLLGNTWNLVPR